MPMTDTSYTTLGLISLVISLCLQPLGIALQITSCVIRFVPPIGLVSYYNPAMDERVCF